MQQGWKSPQKIVQVLAMFPTSSGFTCKPLHSICCSTSDLGRHTQEAQWTYRQAKVHAADPMAACDNRRSELRSALHDMTLQLYQASLFPQVMPGSRLQRQVGLLCAQRQEDAAVLLYWKPRKMF